MIFHANPFCYEFDKNIQTRQAILLVVPTNGICGKSASPALEGRLFAYFLVV